MSPKAMRPIDVAERWQCSERHIRNLFLRGELRGFRAGGKLLRFRLADVEEYEQCASSNIGESGPSSGGKTGSDSALRLVRMTR
ncbi:hypothetical protein GCM10007036_13670 [Alsobacter metallidurans]|uniref:Helix-turn-helix domain-containing protein n=1 Tax=Alsobacter metallidurans TaxID=340221 RepID=A0A917I5X3_9HYPH|nr:helix-turn-helix domain-containing protein [Alsobacter metallidurans]GGH14379.1 hypothetical protein GCM10007036_13670 [Alsobacter metallidurans]